MNELPPLPLRNGVLEIDNSFIERLIACPRSLQYDRLLKRIPAESKPSLSFGTAIHAALEWRYKNLKNASPTVADEQRIVDEVLTPHFAAQPTHEEDHRTLAYAHEVLRQYNKRYNSEPFQLLTDSKGNVMAEMSFCLPLCEVSGVPVYYTGRVDLPVQWDGMIVVVDHKTTSMLGSFYFDGQKVSPQYEGYAWAFEQITQQRVGGYCINAIRTKEMPAKPKSGWDAWWDESFGRHKEYLRPGQIDEWHRNTTSLIEEFFWHYNRGYMPMKKKACTMYGKCAYYDVCYLPETNRPQMLASDLFQNNEWSPLK
jgi:PD-(D/E)XK nuclease superfamily